MRLKDDTHAVIFPQQSGGVQHLCFSVIMAQSLEKIRKLQKTFLLSLLKVVHHGWAAAVQHPVRLYERMHHQPRAAPAHTLGIREV